MPQLEGPTTKNIQLCRGGFGEKKEKEKEKRKSLKKKKKRKLRGRPHGQVVKFARSASVAQCFAGLNPGRGRGTVHKPC